MSPVRRLAIAAGWLLTPLVSWAASLLGGWLGASAGLSSGPGLAGVAWLSAGALIGATAGVIGWALLMRRVGRASP